MTGPFALAVSGGGDSVALMHLAADWLQARALPFDRGAVLTVDHGLRPGSSRDAGTTAEWARRAGFAAHVLRWRGSKPASNVEHEAREARYRLIGDWCKRHGVPKLLLAHTRDDQAETFLLRLARGSGLDGLSAMRARGSFPLPGFDGVELLRPLLGVERAELRRYLKEKGAGWLEDPMNEDPRFARVRIRNVLPALEAAGISVARIADAAEHLGRAREALDGDTEAFLTRHAWFASDGSALFDGAALRALPKETGLRALSALLSQVSGRAYRPRFERLDALYGAVVAGTPARTLAGCRIGPAPAGSRVFGAATLEVRREGARKHAAGSENATRRKAPSDRILAAARAKSPKKRRNMTRLSWS